MCNETACIVKPKVDAYTRYWWMDLYTLDEKIFDILEIKPPETYYIFINLIISLYFTSLL